MSNEDQDTIAACRCLNVRIRSRSGTNTPLTSSSNDPEYTSIQVGDEGITVAHPQVTLRTRSRAIPVPETSRCTRYVTLTCLVCQIIVYRVHQSIPLDLEGKEGPMLPTDDWAERETLKSSHGRIDLHKGCLTGDAISAAEKSALYSSLFSVILPTPSLPPDGNHEPPYISTAQSPPSDISASVLPNMRPIFPPPPFTPSHPVFVHLSSLAASKSQALRTNAESQLAELVKAKVADIEKAENELRRQVELIWRGFREGLGKVDEGRSSSGSRATSRRKSSGNWQEDVEAGSTQPSPARISVREFNPVSSPRRVASPSHAPRLSSLSASLATSSFHHPRAQIDQSGSALPQQSLRTTEIPYSPPPYSSNPSSPSSSKDYSSLSSPSSRSLSIRASEDGPTYLEPFRRNMDQSNDTATSFRYFTILEADSARTRQKETQTNGKGEAGQESSNEVGDESQASKVYKKGKKTEKSTSSEPRSRKATSKADGVSKDSERNAPSESQTPDTPTKGKRKVTFDVNPNVVTIKREVTSEKEKEETERSSRASEEMIFDLEDENGGRAQPELAPPLIEPPHIPTRPKRTRVTVAGLPSSLSSLRPSSLPAPSAVRPSRVLSTPEIALDSAKSTRSLQNSPQDHAKQVKSDADDGASDDSEPLDPREAEILRLVAADTPSHRGAWKKNTKAWQLFVRRQGGKGRDSGGLIMEENEDDDSSRKFREEDTDDDDSDSDDLNASGNAPDIATSMPISIGPLNKPRETLSLASYQPKTSLSDRPGVLVPPLLQRQKSAGSSAAWRKAAYAERDRSRSMDPGALDFALEEDDDDDDDEDAAKISTGQAGRGRQHALKILQVRSEAPASGMWRSLA